MGTCGFPIIHLNVIFFDLAVTLSAHINIMISEVYAGENSNSGLSPANRFMKPFKYNNKSIILKYLGGELNGQRMQKR
jgi:hypothetical protein